MTEKRATRRRGNFKRVYVSSRDTQIIHDFERGSMWAGVIVAVSFGLMFLYGWVVF